MDKTFNPSQFEQALYKNWEKQGYFQQSGEGPPYSIIIPPPNVTGSLHMGHGFQLTLMDVLIRYHRMCGHNTLWQVGTDHAGIATQMVVERQLAAKNLTRHALGRETFLERIWEWKTESGGMITEQMRRLGISVDWQRERFTMDAHLNEAVLIAFEKLYDDGLIYRKKRLVNWDPVLHTAVSDLEVVNKETKGHLWYLRYPLVDDPNQYFTVATTRPETIFGDAAVAVHPKDERYQHLIGRQLILPLTQRTIPIIADDYVDPDFGTGCVKITPAHDFNDYEVGQRHELPLLNIFDQNAVLNEQVPKDYVGLDRFEARKKIVADLDACGLLAEIKPHVLQVPHNDRGQAILEPWLTEQWYINIRSLAARAIQAVQQGQIQFVPENWEKIYFQWMENIQDWCISRQLWWGHRIPAWYDEQGNIYVGKNEAELRNKYQLPETVTLQQDHDVLDTWFSAALWPFASLGWPQSWKDIDTFFPTNVLVTGFDIIFFWVARMIMFSLYFVDKVPFSSVYITGLIRDEKGQKMSKSKGNVLDPIDLVDGIDLESLLKKRTYGLMQPSMREAIEKNTRQEFPHGIAASGTDALRFTYCSLATTGRDIKFDLGRLEGYRNFCNKLWNAARFVIMNTENQALVEKEATSLTLADRWIVSRLEETIGQTQEYLSKYRFDLLAQTLYDFFWYDYCDWYVELAKIQLQDPARNEVERASTRRILLEVLENTLRLLHPLMPFITEAIWQSLKPLLRIEADSLMLCEYPESNSAFMDAEASEALQWLKDFTLAIRNIRGEMNLPLGKFLPVLLRNSSEADQRKVEQMKSLLCPLAKIESITFFELSATAPPSATAVLGQMEILIPLAGLINIEAERLRLSKEIEKLNKEVFRLTEKLANEAYIQKAPPAIVAKEREKMILAQNTLNALQQQLLEL